MALTTIDATCARCRGCPTPYSPGNAIALPLPVESCRMPVSTKVYLEESMRYSVHAHSKLAMMMMLAATTVCLLLTPSAFAGGQSFTTLTSGVTQELYGTGPVFFGGVAFASNGDPVVDECQFGGSQLYRFTASSTLSTVNGTSSLHSVAALPSAAGCGLTNHPDGNIYSNTGAGVVELSASTGALPRGASTSGPAARAAPRRPLR